MKQAIVIMHDVLILKTIKAHNDVRLSDGGYATDPVATLYKEGERALVGPSLLQALIAEGAVADVRDILEGDTGVPTPVASDEGEVLAPHPSNKALEQKDLDLVKMSKPKLVAYALKEYGLELNVNAAKPKLLDAIALAEENRTAAGSTVEEDAA